MPDPFHGELEELKTLVASTGIAGTWQTGTNGGHQYRTKDGAQLNWWETTGTVTYTGKADPKARLEAAMIRAFTAPAPSTPATPQRRRGKQPTIFVVHGHDPDARDQLELALHRLGLRPFILMNTSGGGQTIIEALEGQIGRDYSADFGIVLMTPDDGGYAKRDGAEKADPRARENVILETGMLLASLTRERMALLVKGHVQLPSDLQGIIQLKFNDHVREIVPKLCSRLRESGIEIDAQKVSDACA
jgi:predicted nucleotide-binding protein